MKMSKGYYEAIARDAWEQATYGVFAGAEHYNKGITLSGEVGVGVIDHDPTDDIGTRAFPGSILIQVNEDGSSYLWQKLGIEDTDWGSVGGGTPGVTDHGDLDGLLDNDHPQYVLLSSLTEVGDLWYASASGTVSPLHHGSSGEVLYTPGHSYSPSWISLDHTYISDFHTVTVADAKTVKLDDFATPDANTDLNANTTNHGLLVQATAPATGMYNYVGITYGETAYTNKALFDATVPGTIAENATAAAGSASVAARRDHTHGSPSTYAPTAHNIFSASHGDIAANASPVDGDVIIGNATPKWSKLAISIPSGTGLLNVLGIINGELRPSWKVLFDTTNPAALGTVAPGTSTIAAHRDHVHSQDAILKSVLTEQGDVIYASGVATAAALAHGNTGQLLRTGGNAANPSWSTVVETSGALSSVTTIAMSSDLSIGADSKYTKFGAGSDGQIGVVGDELLVENVTSGKGVTFTVNNGASPGNMAGRFNSAAIPTFNLAVGVAIREFSDDGTMSGNADNAVPTEKAVKGYVDSYTSRIPIVTVSGTVDAILADYTPDITLANMTMCMFIANGANTSATPTFAPDGTTARNITKKGGSVLVAGDIPGSGAVVFLEYNSVTPRWELLNPAMPCYQ